MISEEVVFLLAAQYAVSFFFFGWLAHGWKEDDVKHGRKRFWLAAHYWKKLTKQLGRVNEGA